MRRLRFVAYAATMFVILLGLAASVGAGERVTYSGTIVAIADDAKTFVLAEVGPWRVRNGATVITYLTITLAPETELAIVTRSDTAPSGYPGDFVESRVGPEDIYLNDYVTVDCRQQGKRLVALKITAVELTATDDGSAR
jgi:hypothetical protein